MKLGLAALAPGLALSGCVATIQFRMAEPMVAANREGKMDPPVVTFSRQGGSHQDSAVVAWENPGETVKNRVNLQVPATYEVAVRLPENFEYRRMQMLQAKSETLYAAIEAAEEQLSENTLGAARLLSAEARSAVLEDAAAAQRRIDALKVDLVRAENEAERGRVSLAIDGHVAEIRSREAILREDDRARDALLSPTMVESLVNDVQSWRSQLEQIKGRIVALRMMVENTNDPYPRVIRGLLRTYERTPFTEVGAIPFIIEDEYLDWIRQDKVVTIVSYDPNEKPQDAFAREYRAALPHYWPQHDLYVVELSADGRYPARQPQGGLGASTLVRHGHFNVSAKTIRGANGYTRTYLNTADGERMWVFGPDIEPPRDIEVWLQDSHGLPVQKVYPPAGRTELDEVNIRQIAGVEGGAFDPVREARQRGKVIAITRLGSIRGTDDPAVIRNVHRREMERAVTLANPPAPPAPRYPSRQR